jgi:hypothetical protein
MRGANENMSWRYGFVGASSDTKSPHMEVPDLTHDSRRCT